MIGSVDEYYLGKNGWFNIIFKKKSAMRFTFVSPFSDRRSFFLIVLLNCSSVFLSFSFLSNCVHILGPKNLIECLPYVIVL